MRQQITFDFSQPESSMEPRLGRKSLYIDRDTFLTQTMRISTVHGLRLYNYLCASACTKKEDFAPAPGVFGEGEGNTFRLGIKELLEKGILRKEDKNRYVFCCDPFQDATWAVLGEDELAALADHPEDFELFLRGE